MRLLVTGGAGFLGRLLKAALCERGHDTVSIDLERDDFSHDRCTAVQGDIRDRHRMRSLFRDGRFDAVFHVAAMLAHAVKDKRMLWTSNVDGTAVIADCAVEFAVPTVVFTSSNCLWGESFDRPVREDDEPNPVEIYGRSKWEAEKILLSRPEFRTIVFRCPTIIDTGRLGLLAILFEFIDEGRKVWVVGGGRNRYQFIYAQDLVGACVAALDSTASGVFNIGSDNVPTFREAYEYVIRKAGTGARVANVPRWIATAAMKVAYALRLSPLGPYQYRMIAADFRFDTSKIKRTLRWQPTLTNGEMLWKAYEYYHSHRSDIESRTGVSAHRQAAKMGVIRMLKYLS